MFVSTKGHEVVVEALLKARATVDMQTKVQLYCQLFTSCMKPCIMHMHPCNACGTNNDQLVLEYHLGPYCILNSAIPQHYL